MGRDETGACAAAGQPSHALVPLQPAHEQDAAAYRRSGGRPMAGFLTQLIVEAEPGLRPTRSDRTRTAAALYARAAQRA